MGRIRRRGGQSVTEYLLAVSVLVIAMAAAFYEVIGSANSPQPLRGSFQNVRDTVEAPYP